MSREIIVPREEEYWDFTGIPPCNYDFSKTKELQDFKTILQSPIEELYLGIAKSHDNKLYTTGLIDLVNPDDKNSKAINHYNLEILREKVSGIGDWLSILKQIAVKEMDNPDLVKKKDDVEILQLWEERGKVSRGLINKLIELGIDKSRPIYTQTISDDILKSQVEISLSNRKPLEEFIPAMKYLGYEPILVHYHPINAPKIPLEVEEEIRLNYVDGDFNAFRGKEIERRSLVLRKTPSPDDIAMFKKIGGIGLLIHKENEDDYILEDKNLQAIEADCNAPKAVARHSTSMEKNIIQEYINQFAEDKKRLE